MKIEIREALMEDLQQVIPLIADIVVSQDPVRYSDEVISDPPLDSYKKAFSEILKPPSQALIGLLEARIVGCTQISYVSGLTRRGQKRAIIEDVRVSHEHRRMNIGRKLMERSIEEARARNYWVIQLTTNKVNRLLRYSEFARKILCQNSALEPL